VSGRAEKSIEVSKVFSIVKEKSWKSLSCYKTCSVIVVELKPSKGPAKLKTTLILVEVNVLIKKSSPKRGLIKSKIPESA
jgi:hypothetical protein